MLTEVFSLSCSLRASNLSGAGMQRKTRDTCHTCSSLSLRYSDQTWQLCSTPGQLKYGSVEVWLPVQFSIRMQLGSRIDNKA